ncbi:Hint domain-containing protein [Stigmatella erecta]|uniref:Intein N-terminal splicing region n=1 Tax=Stigmatella erecta TaxID=83460 RepID=A0A1I0LAF2_9BACT|nr:Hint domain-containing protein [Stigmatella erecta]SEU37128.1 intein N-terminal splicing region [Stigmatella erecta]
MNKIQILGAMAVVAGVSLVSTEAEAQPILLQRCSADNLSPAEALARIEWARKCALSQRVGSPGAGFDTGIPAANGGNLIEYVEADSGANPNGKDAFSGPAYGFEVNYANVNTTFLSGSTSQSSDPDGYKKWTRPATRARARPLYPTFGTTANLADANNFQLIPSSTSCQVLNGGAPAATFYVNGYCEASCYSGDQKVLFEGGEQPILDALNSRREDLVTLSSESTLDNVRLAKNKTYGYTVETRDTAHELIAISTAAGGTLNVTDEHPVINGEGRMVQAKTLKTGDELVRADGSRDPIVSIERVKHFGKVYNIRPVTEDLVSNVLVAQGFLVGSSRFQNDDVGYINRVILYSDVPHIP